jgi:signal transduction histidine kinase
LKLDTARNQLKRNPDTTDSLLVELKSQTQSAIEDIRRLVYNLRPPALDELGLFSAT